jgi:surface antigen
MRLYSSPETWVLGALTAFFLAATVLLAGPDARAGDVAADKPSCTCPSASGKAMRPKFAEFSARVLDERDEIAALESVQLGLSRMDDGSAFVWRARTGRLSGVVRPTASFRNPEGVICRHLVVLLTTGFKTRTAEGVACRLDNGRWQLEG